ncbi:MAG TPA: hypothetical protein VF135_03295 [Terriglobales bacterium]
MPSPIFLNFAAQQGLKHLATLGFSMAPPLWAARLFSVNTTIGTPEMEKTLHVLLATEKTKPEPRLRLW